MTINARFVILWNFEFFEKRTWYTEKKELIHSIKWDYWIFFNWINQIFIYDNENVYLNSMKRFIKLQ